MPDLLNVIISSEKRRNLLIYLKEGPRTWDEIKIRLNVTATGMLPQIKILEEDGLINRSGREYSLTDMGQLIVHFLEPLVGTIHVIEQQKKYWQMHPLGVFPPELFLRIRELGTIKLIESGDEEIYVSHTEFQDIVKNSQRVHGMAHMIHPIYPDLFLNLVKKGAETKLILTRRVFEIVREKFRPQIAEWLTYPNAHLYIIDEDIRFSYVVTEKYLSLTLFYVNGVFDSKRDIISQDPSALAWGEDLFTYYMDRSEKIADLGE